jgi:DnaJ-domain-containing protein 1
MPFLLQILRKRTELRLAQNSVEFGAKAPAWNLEEDAAKDSQATVYQKHRSLLNSQEEI